MAVKTTRRVACPRCDTAITGDFKFCPTCAYRLRPGAPEPTSLPGRPARWPVVLVALGALGLGVGLVGLGVLLFSERPAVPAPLGGVGPRAGLDRVRTVDGDLVRDLVPLPPATALYWPDPDTGDPLPVHVGSLRISAYEITRGMYAEYCDDVEHRPDALSPLHQALWRPTLPALQLYGQEHVDLWWESFADHVEATTGERPERPLDLHVPVPETYGILLLVPPSWVYLDAYERFQWRLPEGTENLPITEVSWFDAAAFAEWASARLGVQLRLPLLGEWLRAGNGGDPDRRYPWGEEPLRYGCNNLNYWGDEAVARLHRVDYVYPDADGKTLDGVWGMSGNAREWCYNQEYEHVPTGFFVLGWSEAFEAGHTEAPTAGGSYLDGIQDCTVGYASVVRRDKRGRWPDTGFRLVANGVGVPD